MNKMKNILIMITFLLASVTLQVKAEVFSHNSKLNSGKWVKVMVAENGVYELTRSELATMGFDDMAKVKVYGYGGYLLPEVLESNRITDDLLPVKIGVSEDKIFFYARGLNKLSYSSVGFDREQNHYANYACYFITEEDGAANRVPTQDDASQADTDNAIAESYNYVLHEKNLTSVTKQGRAMLGESFANGSLTVPVMMPALKANRAVKYVGLLGLTVTQTSTLKAKLGDDAFVFTTSSTVAKPSSTREIYKEVKMNATVQVADAQESTNVDFSIANLQEGRLDYAVLTYVQENDFARVNRQSQMLMNFVNLTQAATAMVAQSASKMQVWDVTDSQNPVNKALTTEGENAYFVVDADNGCKQYVAFNPEKPLKKIMGFEPVENQNLHALETPDFVIITTKSLREKAQELAQLHSDYDGITTVCVSQEEVFNEFSSGTADYTAFRYFLKMLYDRNPDKLKNVLYLGPGTYDNRKCEVKADDYLLTFESTESNNTMLSYVTDDYSAMLSEGSGTKIARDQISLGVGRIPCKNEEEATSVLGKIKWHMTNGDCSAWRNNMLIMTDEGDNNIHVSQGEDTEREIQSTLGNKFNIHKINVETYYNSKTKDYNVGREYLRQLFRDGLFYITYLGHGGETSISKSAAIWNQLEAKNTQYSRFPIMMLAACDIANYDNPYRGWGEKLLVWKDRGALGILTSTRVVESSENHRLNMAFIDGMFSPNNNGSVTLGDAYKKAKLSYGLSTSRNKLCFTLFADPALRVSYPQPAATLTSINGTAYTGEEVITPMSQVEVKGEIKNSQGECNSDFNGEVTLTLLDKKLFFKQISYVTRQIDLYTDGKMLNAVSAPVVNGKFAATITVPKDVAAFNEKVTFAIYAVNEARTNLANGLCYVVMGDYDKEKVIADTKEPEIVKMYLNDERSFDETSVVEADSHLHAIVTDDVALSSGINPGAMMGLYVDGHMIQNANNYATVSENGKKAVISYPIYGLNSGEHTLRLEVSDMAGNRAVKSITFAVMPQMLQGSATVQASDEAAQTGTEVEFRVTSDIAESQATVYVTDAADNVVWSGTCSGDVAMWNLRTFGGEAVPAGVYYYHAKVMWTGGSCGTEKRRIVVLN